MHKRLSLSISEFVFPNLYGSEDPEEVQGEQEPQQGDSGGSAPPSADISGGDPQKKIAALEEEKNRHYQARQEAEEELKGLRAFKEESERKTRTETENLQKDLQARDAKIEQLTSANKALAVQIAFLQEPGYEWHNPERALAALDLSSVEIGEDGAVSNPQVLKDAIKKLASEEAWMLKTKKDDGAELPPPSGGAPGGPGSNKQKNAAAEKERLRAKYPALRQH